MSFIVFRASPGESEVDMAKQSFKDECDINVIVNRYKKSGMVSHLAKGTPSFIDVSDVGDLRTVLDRVRDATEWFSHLSAKVREQFGNDPAAFIDVVNSPDRDAIFLELGLLKPVPAEQEAPLQARNPDGTFASGPE